MRRAKGRPSGNVRASEAASQKLSLTEAHESITPRWVKPRLPLLALILMLCGCEPSPSEQPWQAQSGNQSQPSSARPDLDGPWQVAEVDGRTIVGVTLNGANSALVWEPDCAGWFIKYRQGGAAIRFISNNRPPEASQVVCLVGFPDSLPSIFGALAGVDRIEASDTRSVRLTGGGHVIRLEQLQSAAERPVASLEGRWNVSTLNGKRLPTGSLVFSATTNFITWEPVCARHERSYTIENDRIAITQMPDTPPSPPTLDARVVPPRPICAIGLHPKLQSAFTAMEKATHVRPARAGSVKIEGNGHELTLTPAKS